MEEVQRNSGQGLGVAALVMGIISFVVAFIPCIGILALITSIIAVILGAIGLSQAARDNSPRGLMLGGLIVGVIALLVSITQLVVIAGVSSNAPHIGKRIENIVDEIEKDVTREFEDGKFKITIDEGDESVQIEGSATKKSKIDELEKLEGLRTDTVNNDSVNNK